MGIPIKMNSQSRGEASREFLQDTEKKKPQELVAQPGIETQHETLVQKEKESPKQEDGFFDDTFENIKKTLSKKPKKKKGAHIPVVRDELTLQVEHIMEEGLQDAYKELTPIQQQEFKIKGEETALKIRQLLKATHVKIKQVFKLLMEWLSLLPGVGRFFLEQEAKIKTDKLLSLKKRDHDY